MPPEALEFVEMVLDFARHMPSPSVFREVEDEFFHGKYGLPPVEGGPDPRPVRRQPSEAEDVAVPGDPATAIRAVDVTDEP